MLLQNFLVPFGIFCMVFQDAKALPTFAEVLPLLANHSSLSQALNMTNKIDQDLLAEADSSAKLGKAIRMFPNRINLGLSNKKEGFQLWARPNGEEPTPEDSTATPESNGESETPASDSDGAAGGESGGEASSTDGDTGGESSSTDGNTGGESSSPDGDTGGESSSPDGDTGGESSPADGDTGGASNSTDGTKAPGDSGGGGGNGSTGTPGDKGEEKKVSISKSKVDKMGNWVYNPWGVTFGQVGLDTRFNIAAKATMPRIVINSNPSTNYYPKKDALSTVCMGKSTVYNRPHIEKWLPRKIAKYRYETRPIVLEVRRQIYKLGNSEECHVPELADWLGYQLCALRRNQRMEYHLPKYPMQQL